MSPLNDISAEEIFAELRRRNTTQREVEFEMRWQRGHRSNERLIALMVLAVLGAVLVGVIGFMAITTPREPPSLLSGLAGTCLGAIAGILTGKPADQPPGDTSP